VSYLYACNNAQQHTFKQETAQLIEQQGWQQFAWYLDEQADFTGQMDLSLIADELPITNADFYVCGPVAFMESIVKQLESLAVGRDRIHYEVFGPHTYL
ncbi:MAG: NO-inducible flavohemoprotein, partial [Vibrionaceae bacterium]|nr:NO-inducible flavohemoprotein [Vibrionaceae bacterium]